MNIPDSTFEEFDLLSENELLGTLGLSVEDRDCGRVENLQPQDLRNAIGAGQRWFAEFKDKAQKTICASAHVKEFATSSRSAERIAMCGIIATALMKRVNVNEEGAIAFSILLLREGLAKYCNSEWDRNG